GSQLTLGYDGANRLVQLTRTTPEGQTSRAHYAYDALGRRLHKTVHHPDGSTATTRYGWEGDRLVSEERDTQRTTVIYEPGSFVPMVRLDQTANPTGHDAPRLATYVTDALGTPLQLLDPDGTPRWHAQPDDWAAVKDQGGTTAQPIRFQGQWHDDESGLYYNRHRYYDPDTGRYITQDPIGLSGGLYLYQYAAAPTSEIDPMGLRGVYGLGGGPYSQSNAVRQGGNELEASLSGGLTGQVFGGIAGVSVSRNKIVAENGTFNSTTVCWQLGLGVYTGGGGLGTLQLSSEPVSPGVYNSWGGFFSGGGGFFGGGGSVDLNSGSVSAAKAFAGPGVGGAGGLQFCRTWVHERGDG
ncbi:RHS repeat-associated core domain-containing protein, partial [Halomonas sabkhae]|uniref:RHS repeat-associated core domain-containing protein n=1 Tax=Halomonas sabkhae TaxID=626223 RepID=UPI0025B39B6F